MNIPNFAPFEYIAADIMNAAMTSVSGSIALTVASLSKPGLLAPEVMGFSISGMNLTTTLPVPFAVDFGNGVIAQAHGTVTNADTQSYTNGFASLVPGSGSVTAYLVASYVQIQQAPRQVVGPPAGHPDYNPAFISYTMYQQNVDSIAVTATTTPPDGINTHQLATFTLTAGMSTLPAPTTTFNNRASELHTYSISGGVSGVINPLPLAYAGTSLRVNGAATLTLPPVSGANGLVYQFISITTGLVTINSADPILGWSQTAGASVNSITLANGASVELLCARGQWQVIGGSVLGINAAPPAVPGIIATSPLFATLAANNWTIGVTTNAITNAFLAQMPAFTFHGNMTGATANAANVSLYNSPTIAWDAPVANQIGMDVRASSITNALLAAMPNAYIKGNTAGGPTNPSDLQMISSPTNQWYYNTGQIGSILIPGSVTNGYLASMPNATLKGNMAGGPTTPSDITIINTGTVQWVVPAATQIGLQVAASSISNGLLAGMPNATVKGNVAGGTTNPQDIGAAGLHAILGMTSYNSGGIAITSGGQPSFAYNVGVLPNITNMYLLCQSNDQGYPAGFWMPVHGFTISSSPTQQAMNSGVTLIHNPQFTAFFLQFGNAPSVFAAPSRGNGPGFTTNLVNGKWVLVVHLFWLGL